MRCISVKIMVISVSQKKCFPSQPFLKMRKFLLDMTKNFLIMSNSYLVEILNKPNSFTIVTSKNILKMSNYLLILSIFFPIMRIRSFVVYALFESKTSKLENVRIFKHYKILIIESKKERNHYDLKEIEIYKKCKYNMNSIAP